VLLLVVVVVVLLLLLVVVVLVLVLLVLVVVVLVLLLVLVVNHSGFTDTVCEGRTYAFERRRPVKMRAVGCWKGCWSCS
jgi:hypothetical protein